MDKLLFKRILIAFLSLLAVIYVVYLLVSANFDVAATENAVEVSVTETVYADAFIIRNESYLYNDNSGVLSYTAGDGEQVNAGASVAKVYLSENDATAQSKIEALQERVDSLEELQENYLSNTVGIDTINNTINDNIITYISNAASGNFDVTADNLSNLIYSINQRKLSMGSSLSFTSEISELNSQISELKATSSSSIGEITTDTAGYFSSYCDGYENCFSYSDIDDITLDDLNNFTQKEVPSNAAGKIISGLNWYIVCEVTSDEAVKLSLWEKNVSVNFSDTSSETVLASIYSVKQSPDDKNKAIAVFKCSYMNEELSRTRLEPVEIGLGTYTGLRVSKKAIHDDYIEVTSHDEDGNAVSETKKVQGVYVLYGSEVQFKEISILYSGSDYVVCDEAPPDGVLFSGETLSLYDQVILEGDKLYDGKVIE